MRRKVESTKKCPLVEGGHNPRMGPDRVRAVRRVRHTFLHSGISVACSADACSIGGHYDAGMTWRKVFRRRICAFAEKPGARENAGKKKPARGRLKTIFLEENSGDRSIMLCRIGDV